MFDLGRLRLTPGEARRLELAVPLGEFSFGGQRYVPEPAEAPARLDVTRMTGGGSACACASRRADRAVHALPGAGRARGRRSTPARSTSRAAARSSRARTSRARSSTWPPGRTTRSRSACPTSSCAAQDCAGLCPECGADLNEAGPEHRHEAALDPRWAKLRELRFE